MLGEDAPESLVLALDRAIAALTPVTDEEVQYRVTMCRAAYDNESADLIERLAREAIYNRNVMEAETLRANKAQQRTRYVGSGGGGGGGVMRLEAKHDIAHANDPEQWERLKQERARAERAERQRDEALKGLKEINCYVEEDGYATEEARCARDFLARIRAMGEDND